MELTTSQAVQRYGVFPNVIHRMILMGRLDARKDANGRWLISEASLEKWNAQRVRRNATTRNAIAPIHAEVFA